MFKIIQKFSVATSLRPPVLPSQPRIFNHPSFVPIRNFHSTIMPQAKQQASVDTDQFFDEEEGIYKVKGTEVPPQFSHFFSDPEGKKSRRDAILQKKVRRLRRTQAEHRRKKSLKSNLFNDDDSDFEPFTVRQRRVAELILEGIHETLAKENFPNYPNVKANCSFEDVEISRDLRLATVFFAAVDPALEPALVAELNDANFRKFFRVAVTKRISHVKFAPEYIFVNDAERVRVAIDTKLSAAPTPEMLAAIDQKVLKDMEEQEAREDPHNPQTIEDNLLIDMRMALQEYKRYVEENNIDDGKAFVKDLHNTILEEIKTQQALNENAKQRAKDQEELDNEEEFEVAEEDEK